MMSTVYTKREKVTAGGFTLLELLVSVGVISVIGVSIASILVSSLRDANKSNIVSVVRQNGDYTLSQMARNIRTAQSLQYPTPPCVVSNPPASDHIQFTTLTNTSVTYTCSGNTITSAAGSLLDVSTVKVVAGSCNFYCTQDSPSESPVIKIIFSLVNATNTNVVEQSAAPIQFQTSVLMRNISR